MAESHLLVDVDSRIPNLALMRISSWLKARGHEVVLLPLAGRFSPTQLERPLKSWTKVWVSCVFTWNRPVAESCRSYWQWLGTPVEVGGSGVSLAVRLPWEIESMLPDYRLYKDDRVVGFYQRGCIRKCDFCVVPQKEGRIADNPPSPLEEWVPDGRSKILLLDNEFAAQPFDVQQRVLASVKENKWKLSITQGYDLRCVTPELANLLAWEKPWDLKFKERRLYCAWDYIGIEPYVRQGLRRLLDGGFKGREIMVYMLVGYNTTHLQDLYRFKVLWREHKVLPFVMRYNMRTDDPFLNALARYANRGPAAYRGHDFASFCAHYNHIGVAEEAKALSSRLSDGGKVSMASERAMPRMKDYYS